MHYLFLDSISLSFTNGFYYFFRFVRYGCIENAVQAIKELHGWRVKSQKIVVDLANETLVKMKKKGLYINPEGKADEKH